MKWYYKLLPWRRYDKEHAKAERRIDRLNKVVDRQQPEVDQMHRNLEKRLQENHFTLAWEELMKGRDAG